MSKPLYEIQHHLKPKNLVGISQDQIDDHWKLYEGYVKQVCLLNTELFELYQQGKHASTLFADRRRRYGFEYNGMVLHEYYFDNLITGNNELSNGELKKAIERSYGTYEIWKADFEAAGKTRGIGWAILYADNVTGHLTNHFIAEHSHGNVAGFTPILVLDVWEHAYMVDHRAGGRGDYIAAFMQNINWNRVEERYEAVRSGKIINRW